jgi:hypothetical protein
MSEALVCGLYRTETALEYAICHLRNVGFLDQNFSVIFPSSDSAEKSGLKALRAKGGDEALSKLLENEIVLSVRCESGGQAAIAKKILECTNADTVVSSGDDPSIAFSADKGTKLS